MSSQPYHIKEIAEILNAKTLQNGKNVLVQTLAIDSRSILWPFQTLFFCLATKQNNGHKYISEAYQKGVRNFIISEEIQIGLFPEASFLKVENTLNALQLLAQQHRNRFNIPVIAVTGSNGKTIVKEWLFQLLQFDKNIVRSPKSYNSQIGVPLSVWQINSLHQLGIFEAGISMPCEMEKLEQIIQPDIVIITNIKEAHLENFTDKANLVSEKVKLAKKSKVLVYNKAYTEIEDELLKPEYNHILRLGWDMLNYTVNEHGSKINFQLNNQNNQFELPYTDLASIENAIHCYVTLLYLGYTSQTVSQKMLELTPVAMRLEIKKGINHCTLINDTYNSDIASLEIALDLLNQQHQHQTKTLILSDILQSGKNEVVLYKEIAALVNKKNVHKLICIGENITKNATSFKSDTSFFPNTNTFLESGCLEKFSNEAILVKGSRVFGFELIINKLQQKKHETVLEVNLSALINNYNFFKSKLQPQTKVMAMVKAFSYGAGTYEIANALQHYRVDYLAVAFVDEGVELRKAGISVPIMVMNPEISAFENLIEYNLEPEIYSFRILHAFTEELQKHSINEPYPIHLKIDTGMHRLGFLENEIDELAANIGKYKNIRIASVFSHLSSSDEISLDFFTNQQIDTFNKVCSNLIEKNQYPFIRHILNSNGILRFPQAQFEMVRLGIGLFGIAYQNIKELQSVVSLKTTISQIKKVKQGDAVGYNCKGIAEADTNIAIVPIGYADGLSRKLGNGSWKMLINGKEAPIMGNVCMDMCMLNIAEIQCKEGDEVIVFNELHSINLFAEVSETIPYEVLTSISPRVKRNYLWI
ncbi:MAG: bifunctional UDP-N-acetylmuramoyl-tripeptide:D-alanyl-D-alanine ligase/alanine racemase [Flavobacteriales bacterium]|nr:bifunctional UDP-N-acetylmuramoyl-tripeptide:D-alanyl-D-alanine ligase/alanine racemase [Flavobacteriales bacterium]